MGWQRGRQAQLEALEPRWDGIEDVLMKRRSHKADEKKENLGKYKIERYTKERP